MSKKELLVALGLLVSTSSTFALSSDALEGKALYPACQVCHNPAMDPPLGPPMWGVARKYKNNTLDKEDFIKSMVSFVKAPTLEKAIHEEALNQLGLMPPMPLPDPMLHKISTYIFEEAFLPPCSHWKIAVKRAESKGDLGHAKKDKRMFERYCN